MRTLREYIKEAQEKKVAIGHFNISDIAGLKGIFEAARNLGELQATGYQLPIMIGVSEGERDFVGVKNAAALVKNLREEFGYPIFLNADHTHSFENIKKAVEAGFDEVLFDGGKLSMEENIKQTKEVVEYVKNYNAANGTDVLVEAELGYLGSSSVILTEVPEGAAIKPEDLTKPDVAANFVKETGIDLLAPAIGNIHGMFKNAPNPHIDIERIKELAAACGVPLVLHGGSGIIDEEFVQAINNGIAIVHINTEIRLAWRKGIEKTLQEKPDEVVPYKILLGSIDEVKKVVEQRLKIFNKL